MAREAEELRQQAGPSVAATFDQSKYALADRTTMTAAHANANPIASTGRSSSTSHAIELILASHRVWTRGVGRLFPAAGPGRSTSIEHADHAPIRSNLQAHGSQNGEGRSRTRPITSDCKAANRNDTHFGGVSIERAVDSAHRHWHAAPALPRSSEGWGFLPELCDNDHFGPCCPLIATAGPAADAADPRAADSTAEVLVQFSPEWPGDNDASSRGPPIPFHCAV